MISNHSLSRNLQMKKVYTTSFLYIVFRRLYQFVGTIPTSTEPPMFSHIFSKYEDKDIPGIDLCLKHFAFHAKSSESLMACLKRVFEICKRFSLSLFFAFFFLLERFLEIPGEFGDSVLQLYYPKYRQPPRKFAWMTGK